MTHSPKYSYPYRTKPPLSNSDVPWVTVKFPSGLSGPPEIYCFADTFEETAKVREIIERALNQGKAEG